MSVSEDPTMSVARAKLLAFRNGKSIPSYPHEDRQRDQDTYVSEAQKKREEKITAACKGIDNGEMLTEILYRALPKMSPALRTFAIQPHVREVCRLLWQENIASFYMQDDRLKKEERAIIAAIARRLHGGRSVI